MSTLRSLSVALALLAGGALTCLPGGALAQQPPQQPVIVQPPPPQPVPGYYTPPPGQPVPGYYTPPPGQPVVVQPPPVYYAPPSAQPVPGYYPPPAAGGPVDPAAQQMYHSGRALRRAGKPLTIIGAVLMPLGLIVAVAGSVSGALTAVNDCSISTSSGCANRGVTGAVVAYYGGLGMTVVGVAMLGAGIPLWVVGQRRMNQARSLGAVGLALDTPRLHLQPLYLPNSSTLAGGTAGLSFAF
jgi:hypothetical protein